ncbi:MAG: hypothetical protein KBD17_00505 [Candidatus Pacebacteria bacterium]|nr:hypothetical protein [Candidatus Paceibacterota bacterium]
MTAQEFIQKRLGDLKAIEVVSSFESDEKMTEFIFSRVLSKKFRKFSVSPEYLEQIRKSIEINVSKKEPIKFAFSFGGYKLWRLEERSEPDWAELFAIIYYCRWMQPILNVYKPGIWFDFVTDGIILEKLNNVPKEESKIYRAEFQKLLDFIKPYTPTNLKLTLTEIGDFYSSEKEFEEDLADKINKLKSSIGKDLPDLTPEDIARVELNVNATPEQKNDPKWREKVKLLHDSYMTVSKKRPYYKTEDKIMVLANALNGMLALGTTKTSTVKFWVGVGALQRRDNSFIETILSTSQLEKAKLTWEPVTIEGLEGKNFKTIRII